jgi:hypothetical protein
MQGFRTAILLVSAVVLPFLSCGVEPISGGSGTETVNTFAVLCDGKPANGAIVSLIDPHSWLDSIGQKASPVLQRTVADEHGRFSLTLPESNRPYNIQIDHSEQGYFVESVLGADLEDDTCRLEPFASYRATFDTEHDITRMYLSGSTYLASVGSDGNFYFTGVAPGSYTIVGVSGAPSPYRVLICGSATLATSQGLVASSLNPEYGRLLLDNFESGFGPTALGGIAPELWWYSVSDSGMYYWKRSTETWRWSPYEGHSYTSLSTVSAPDGGSALRFVAVLDSTVVSPIATSGIFFKDLNPEGIDLSEMTGCSFSARGKGTISVRFESTGLDTISGLYSAYSYPLVLTGQWTDYFVSVDSLEIQYPVFFPEFYPWSKESRHILRIEFEFSKDENNLEDTLHLELDNLYLEGVGVEVLER